PRVRQSWWRGGACDLAHGMLPNLVMTRVSAMAKSSLQPKQRTVARSHHRVLSHRRSSRRIAGLAERCGVRVTRRVDPGSTLLALVQEVQRHVENDADVVRIIRWMVNTGVVVLTGTFAGRAIS